MLETMTLMFILVPAFVVLAAVVVLLVRRRGNGDA